MGLQPPSPLITASGRADVLYLLDKFMLSGKIHLNEEYCLSVPSI